MNRPDPDSPDRSWAGRRPVPCCQVGVLHVFGPGRLQESNHQIEFHGHGDRRLRVSPRELRLACLYGPIRLTTGALRVLSEAGTSVAYLSADGSRLRAVVQPGSGTALDRRYRQYRAVQDLRWSLDQSRGLVAEKLDSIRAALEYERRQGRGRPHVAACLGELAGSRDRVATAADLATLRGLEGLAARRWFEVMAHLLPAGWALPGRVKRPPTDPVNALLSLGYTLLHQRVLAACAAWGLDPAAGFYHEFRPGRASLACDLCEPFRVPAVDRLVLRLLALRVFQPSDFAIEPASGAQRLSAAALRRYIEAMESHLHAADTEAVPSLQVRIMDRVGQFAASLPPGPSSTFIARSDPATGSPPD